MASEVRKGQTGALLPGVIMGDLRDVFVCSSPCLKGQKKEGGGVSCQCLAV